MLNKYGGENYEEMEIDSTKVAKMVTAQVVEQWTADPDVLSSIPIENSSFLFYQLPRYQSEALTLCLIFQILSSVRYCQGIFQKPNSIKKNFTE